MVSTGPTSRKTLAPRACFEERPHLNKTALLDLTSATPHIWQDRANIVHLSLFVPFRNRVVTFVMTMSVSLHLQ
jgi:hypothetical protein